MAAGLLATMMIGTMLTGCGGGNKKDSGSSKKETSEINIGFSQVGAESDWRVAKDVYKRQIHSTWSFEDGA